MAANHVLAGLIAGVTLLTSIGASSQEITVQEFRERLIAWAISSQRAVTAPEQTLAARIANLSDEQVEIWFNSIDDPEAFLEAIDRVITRQEGEALWSPALEPQSVIGRQTATTLTTLFPPDYPPGSGAYQSSILSAIAGFGISGASSTNRCDAADWADYVGVWWPLNKGIDALDGACVVAGCDPIGIVCATACGILEVAKVALKVAAVPLEACDVHQDAIDGAEIEATYENTQGLVGDVSQVHDDLAAHDTNIDGDLATHDANIDGDLVAHDANIDGDLAAHDANIDADLVAHDADIKALLSNLQAAVAENRQLIKIAMSRQLELMRLLVNWGGLRGINSEVLSCTGDDCPGAQGAIDCREVFGWSCR